MAHVPKWKPYNLIVLKENGKPHTSVDAYPTSVPGLVAHVIPEEPYLWTISHWSGYRIGGRFHNLHHAVDKCNDHFQLYGDVNWRKEPQAILPNPKAKLAYDSFRALYQSKNAGIAAEPTDDF